MPKRYILLDLDVEGLPARLLLSNREYRPTAGPNAGKPYRAAWTAQSYRSWKITKAGLRAEGNLTRTTGLAAFQPGEVELVNARPTPGSAREFDALLGLEEVSGTWTARIANARPGGGAPDWADFAPFGAGIIRRKPRRVDRGKRIILSLEPTQADLERPLLTRRFTGYGSYFFSTSTVQSPSAPPVMGSNFTLQVYGQVVWDNVIPIDPIVYLYRLRNAANATLLSVYVVAPNLSGDFDIFAQVLTAAGLSTYSLGTVPAASKAANALRLDEIIFSWDEDNAQIKGWVNGLQTLGESMSSPSSGAGTENHFQMFVTRPLNFIYMSAVRVFDVAITEESEPLRLVDIHGPLSYPEDHLVSGYEFSRGIGLDLIDSGSAGVDLVALSGGWGSLSVRMDGQQEIAGAMLPAAFGQAFNVPTVLFDRRKDIDLIAAAAFEVIRGYVNGVHLTPTVSYVAHVIVDGNRGTMRLTGTAPAPVDFGMALVPGAFVDIAMPGLSGNFQIVDIDPDPFAFVRKTTSGPSPVTVILSGIPAGSYVGVATVTTTLPFWDALNSVNPYSGAVELPTIGYAQPQPPGITMDMIGDPEIVATSPPAATFVDPGDVANVAAQMLTRYGVAWDSSRFTIPSYGLIPGSAGVFVNDERGAGEIIAELLTGYNAWLDETPDGVSELRQLTLDDGPVDHVIPEGSIIDVSTPGRQDSGGAEGLNGLEVRYRRAWVQQDRGSIPEAASKVVAAFVSQGYQRAPVGSSARSGLPIFETFEVDRRQARRNGETALALSRKDPVNVRLRKDPKEAAALYRLGDKVATDAPAFDLPSFSGRIGGIDITPAAGTVTLTLVEV